MAKEKLEAHVGWPVERLIGEGANQSMAVVRDIDIFEGTKKLRTIQSADNNEDVYAQITKSGFIVGERNGNTLTLTRRPMTGFEKGFLGCFGAVAVVLVLIVGGCVAVMNGGSDKTADESDAQYMCQQFVKDKLKSPSSAKFSNQVASGAGSSWTSSGTVESQNSFGAMIQTRYSCTLNYLSSDESWTGSAKLS